jgi:hypothetical protein
MLLALGLRHGEALGLEWDDVDLDKAPCLRGTACGGPQEPHPGRPAIAGNKNVHPSAAARKSLLVGQVDPRLLVTLSTFAHEMPLERVAVDDSSPGERSDVPLREAEIAAAAADLSAMIAFLNVRGPIPAREGTGNPEC